MLKLILPISLQEEIANFQTNNSPSARFWGGLLGEDQEQIEEVIPLPPLNLDCIEEVLSEQPYSFDVIIGIGEMSDLLREIQAFCDDMGLYFHHVSPSISDGKKKRSSKTSDPQKKVKKMVSDNAEILQKEVSPQLSEKEETDNNQKKSPVSVFGSLDTQKLREIFTHMEDVSLNKRPQQIRMIRMILDAFQEDSHLIVEASTGTGKSLAYLLCSILLADQKRERVLIATHTKMLQSQLMEKDVPMALSLLGSSVKIKLAKGKSNYLCLRRFFEGKKRSSSKEEDLFGMSKDFLANRELLDTWITQTSNGDLDTLPSNLQSVRKEICMQSDLCDKKTCPFISRCFYYKEWEQWEKASIIIVNHALLVSELDFQYREIPHEVIPAADRLVIDEAHHFAENSLRELSYSSEEFFFIRDALASSKDSKGILPYISKLLGRQQDMAFSQKALRNLENLISLLNPSFDHLVAFFDKLSTVLKTSNTLRATEKQNPFLSLQVHWEQWKDSFRPVLALLQEVLQNLQSAPDDFKEANTITIAQIQNFHTRIEDGLGLWDRLFETIPTSLALWVESPKPSIYTLHMIDTYNEIFLQQTLWQKYRSVVLTSATLSHERALSKIQSKLHVPEELILKKSILPPIFDYSKKAKFFIPSDIPDPTSEEFPLTSLSFIASLVQSTSSGILILATALKQMNEIGDFLNSLSLDRPIFIQGQLPISHILNEAKTLQNAVIVGVDSFWEGIDLPGKALELLIIMKLPFTPPGNPLIETLSEVQEENGHNAFNTILLDGAITKFQQGVGRLLRSTEDSGIVVCLDNRLMKKFYGKKILASLYMQPKFQPQSQILSAIQDHFSSQI